MPSLKILFIAPIPPPTTGQSLACQTLHDEFTRCGHEVRLVNLSKNSFKHGVNSLSRVFEVLSIAKQVMKNAHATDLIYLTPSESVAGNLKDLLIYALLWRKLDRVHLHLHGGGGMKELLSSSYPKLRALNSWFIRRMAGVIVLGDRHAPIYHDVIPSTRISIVKNFAPDDCFIDDAGFSAKWQEPGPRRALFLSNLIPGKGYEFLLSAIKNLAPEVREKYVFDFAGGFESESDKNNFVGEIAKYPEIKYHGVVHGKEKTDLLLAAHIFCLPSYLPEGQPISILEAYAAGCAVITTNCGGIFDIFSPEQNGLEVTPNSASSIEQALHALVSANRNPQLFAAHNIREARSKFRRGDHLQNMRNCLRI